MSHQLGITESPRHPATLLRVYLLGPPQVTWAGQPIAIPRRQARALLSQDWERGRGVQGGGGEGLQHAIDLYRGPFLAGFSLPDSAEFEVWAFQERSACERLYLEALSTLLEQRAARGEFEAAITCAQRYLATDDLAEEVHRRLIELYAASGDRSAALRQFEYCATVLERELGVEPLPETEAVYQAALEGRAPPVVAPVVEPAWATLPGLDLPLVGREQAFHRLEQAFARARSGQGRVVLISGEAGMGKSRLMQEFATRLPSDVRVLSGAGYLDTQTMPYQPITQALRSALNVPQRSFNVQPVWLAEAARLLPELHSLYPDLPVPLEAQPEEARARLFEALCQLLLGSAGGRQPALLCLDDLHWADSTTLDWLAYLAARLRGRRLMIVGTYRSEEADTLSELRRNLSRLRVLSDLPLAALDTPAVHELLRHLNGHAPGAEAIAGWLREVTGGNPFFLMETLRTLIEAGQPLDQLSGPEALPLPDTIRDAVGARLERLSPQARQVLEAGAILGPSFSFELVRQTAGAVTSR